MMELLNRVVLAEYVTSSEIVFGNREWLPYVLIAAVGLVALTAWSYRKSAMPWHWRWIALPLRLVGIALLLACLLEPLQSMQRPKSQSNVFAVLLDNSQSMSSLLGEKSIDPKSNSQDVAAKTNGIDALLDDEADWQRQLSEDFRVRRYLFDSLIEPVESFSERSGQGTESAIYGSLQSIEERFRHQPLAGVILLTDGNSTDSVDVASIAKLHVPVYPVRLPAVVSKPDLTILSASTRQSDFETSPITIHASIGHVGLDNEPAMVALLDSQGKTVQSQSITLKKATEPVSIEFRFRPEKSGVQGYQLLATTTGVSKRSPVEPATDATESSSVDQKLSDQKFSTSLPSSAEGGELTLGNNRRFQVVDRGRGPYRILYIAGRPNWEYKFLKRGLDEDDEIRLTSLIRIARKEPKFSFRDSKLEATNPLFSGFEGLLEEEKEQYDEPVFARLGLTEEGQLKTGFPKDADELFEYSAIIIDDLEHDFFTRDQQSLIRQFVAARGGGLIVLGGQESMRGKGFKDSVLSQLLPIYGEEGIALAVEDSTAPFQESQDMVHYQLTRDGWLQPFLRVTDNEAAEKERLAKMPPFEVINRIQRTKPGAVIFAEAETIDGERLPLFVSQRFGKGRTAALMVGDLWRWGMRYEGTGQPPLFQSWRQMIRWLIADVPKPIEMRLVDNSAHSKLVDIEVIARGTDFQAVDNATVHVRITAPSGKTWDADATASTETVGHYLHRFVCDEEGVYAAVAEVKGPDGASMGSSQLGWVYQPSIRELQNIGVQESRLQEIADATGGKVIDASDLDSFAGDIPMQRIPVTETRIFPLWHDSWVVVSALACLCIEWGMRRRYGMA